MLRTALYRAGLDLLHMTCGHLPASPLRGLGAIFMLHHVRPEVPRSLAGFAHNAGLEITPQFLGAVITRLKQDGYRLVSLTEAAAHLRAGGGSPPIAAFTLDDGYRDNHTHAWPVFRALGCPFTIFITPAIADGTCVLWWRVLEAVIALRGSESDAARRSAFWRLYWSLRRMPPGEQTAAITKLCREHGVNSAKMCREHAMNWGEIRDIASDPLCSIGAHGINHFALARLTRDEAWLEITRSRDRIAREIGRPPTTFAYPYGDAGSCGPREFALVAEAGFDVAVTTRKDVLRHKHAWSAAALPRLPLNGAFQDLRYVETLLSGIPSAWRAL